MKKVKNIEYSYYFEVRGASDVEMAIESSKQYNNIFFTQSSVPNALIGVVSMSGQVYDIQNPDGTKRECKLLSVAKLKKFFKLKDLFDLFSDYHNYENVDALFPLALFSNPEYYILIFNEDPLLEGKNTKHNYEGKIEMEDVTLEFQEIHPSILKTHIGGA